MTTTWILKKLFMFFEEKENWKQKMDSISEDPIPMTIEEYKNFKKLKLQNP